MITHMKTTLKAAPEVADGGTARVPLSPTQKLAIADGLWHTAWELAAAGVRDRNPSLTEEEVARRVGALFLRVRT
jgi:hypothetical protein